jgi:hypothetical protein
MGGNHEVVKWRNAPFGATLGAALLVANAALADQRPESGWGFHATEADVLELFEDHQMGFAL